MADAHASRSPDTGADVVLVPLMGPLHLTYPQYNAVTVRDAVVGLEPAAVVTSALTPGAMETPLWQDTPELPLPHAVVPWARRSGTPFHAVGEASPDADAVRDFERYTQGYPALSEAWRRVRELERPLEDLLARPLTLERIVAEALPLVEDVQAERETTFGDGPATDWIGRRTSAIADRVVALADGVGDRPLALVAPLEHVPGLLRALVGRAATRFPASPPPSDAARRRSILDHAMKVDVDEPGELIRRLREMDAPEARYHEANLLLAHGHAAEALEVLEAASREDFAEPYYLPGYLLSRLGQLLDLAGRRDAAMRAYRGVLALSYAPPEARAAAQRGLRDAFALGEDA